MFVERVNDYTDERFQKEILNQHGAFLIEESPYSVKIVSLHKAVISGKDPSLFEKVIETFRYYAEHITVFIDEQGNIVKKYPDVKLFPVNLFDIQPSQLFVNENKLEAVSTFVNTSEDVVIPLMENEGEYISLDGHTRMKAAELKGIETVYGLRSHDEDYGIDFSRIAKRKKITSIKDVKVLNDEDYDREWIQLCENTHVE